MNPGTNTEPVISLGPAAHEGSGSCCLLESHHTSHSSSFPGLWGLKIEQKRPTELLRVGSRVCPQTCCAPFLSEQ